MEERKLAVADSLNSLEEQGKRRTDLIERQIAETEKKLKALRESVSTQHSEQVLALHVLDDLKAQCADLERIADSRRRAIEDEVSQAQQQVCLLSNRKYYESIFLTVHNCILGGCVDSCRSQRSGRGGTKESRIGGTLL